MKIYYHGTSYYSAYRILKEGFRIVKYYGGGCAVKGKGIYVTDNLNYAYDMAISKGWNIKDKNYPNKACIIQCDLNITNPIFWTKKEYDNKVITYLKKEFSKNIVDYNQNINKFIPKNKKLTKSEVIHLVNYWHTNKQKAKDRFYKNKSNIWGPSKEKGDSCFLDNVRFLLSRYNFSGWGQYTHDCWDSDEIVIFNPSEVVPIKVYNVISDFDEKEFIYRNTKISEEAKISDLKKGYDYEVEYLKKEDEKYGENYFNEMYK